MQQLTLLKDENVFFYYRCLNSTIFFFLNIIKTLLFVDCTKLKILVYLINLIN